MALAKVAAVIYIRELIHAKGEQTENKFLKSLLPEDRECFQQLMPTKKLPIEQLSRYCELAVTVLFPNKSLEQGLWQLGYQNAQNDMKGIYKVLLKIATVEMVIKKASVIWKTYHDEGKSSAQQVKDKQFVFLVENYPDLPKTYRIITEGYITALANLVGEKYVEVVCDDVEPSAWKWLITIN